MEKDGRKKIRILIVAGALGMGGLENQLVYVGKHIDHEKFEVDYSSTDENAYYKDDIINSGCGFFVVPDPRKDGTIAYCKAMYQLMKKGKYNVVHSQELFHSGIEMFLAWLAHVPKRIAHSHSTQDGSNHNTIFKKIYHAVMRKSILFFGTDFLACSTAAGMFLYGSNIVKNKHFEVVVNSVETSQYFINEVNDSVINKKPEWKYVTHVGRFVEVKNHDFMINIANRLKNNDDKICFVFVGNGELFEHCVERVEKEELNDYVQFLGQRTDVVSVLKESDAFILPSHYEGMPLSIIEAQAAGLPCLVADHITEEVDFGINLIHKKSLNDNEMTWIKELKQVINQCHPDSNTIIEAIHKKGFDVSDFQNNLCEIYIR